MRDDEIVAKVTRGDPAALAGAYDRYAPGLHSYCRMLLREPEDAAAAAADTFVVAASRLAGLRDTSRLRPWLYAVARNECVRRLHSREIPSVHAPGNVAGGELVIQQTERAGNALIHDALQGAGPAEREALHLRLQDLDPGEIGDVLGVSRKHADALLSRARGQLKTSLGVLLVARTCREECPALDAMLEGWDGRLTPKLRRQVDRHLEHCAVCTVRRHQELTPGLLAEAGVPLAAASLPAGLWRQVIDAVTSADTGAVLHRAAVVKLAGSFSRRTGFPARRAAPERRHRRVVRFSAAGTAAAGAAAAVVIVANGAQGLPFMSHGLSVVVSAPASMHFRPHASPGSSGPGAAGRLATRAGRTLAPPTASAGTTSASPSPGPASSPVALSPLSVSPSTLTLTSAASSTFTITARGQPVSWSLSGPDSLVGTIAVSATSGTLAAGQSVNVTVTELSVMTANSQLTVSPGGEVITLIAGA